MRGGIARRRFFVLHACVALFAAALLIALEHTGVDSAVSGWFFDPATRTFPLQHDPALEIAGHQLARHLVVVIACCVIALYALSHALPQLERWRRVLLFMSLGMTLAPLTVVLLKAISARHCPWDLLEFGGYAEHLAFFESAPPGIPPGHCFPAGHASGGFCLFVLYFAGHALGKRLLQWAGLCTALAAGFAFGLVRIVQGAHFLSHVLWSALVCWVVILVLYACLGLGSLPRRVKELRPVSQVDHGEPL